MIEEYISPPYEPSLPLYLVDIKLFEVRVPPDCLRRHTSDRLAAFVGVIQARSFVEDSLFCRLRRAVSLSLRVFKDTATKWLHYKYLRIHLTVRYGKKIMRRAQ